MPAGNQRIATDDAPVSNSIKTPRLSTEDNWIVDPDGNKIVLRGVNIDDPLWADYYDDRSSIEKVRMATSGDWFARVIRVPCSNKHIADEADGDVEWYAEQYMDPIVDETEERGVYVVLDWHEADDWDDPSIQDAIETFWDVVAPRYADRDHVLYELFNEPVGSSESSSLDSIETWKDWRETAQPWVDSIRADAPETPIIIGSPRWSQMTKYAGDAPLEGNDLIYATHLYPSHYENMDLDAIADAATTVPVALTEWGYINDDEQDEHMVGTTSGYGQGMREWLAENPNISWMPWCFGRQYTPNTFSSADRERWDESWNLLGGEDYMGEFVRDFLADARDGEHSPTPTT